MPQDGQWCKVFVSKSTNAEGREFYFSNLETGESSWEEPRASYWLWDYGTQTYHVSGLQQPTSTSTLTGTAMVAAGCLERSIH